MSGYWIQVVPIMCPIRKWFFEFQELDGGVVYMGNDNPCKTAGIGSIKLQNHDGFTGCTVRAKVEEESRLIGGFRI